MAAPSAKTELTRLPVRFGLALVAAYAFALTNTFSRGAYSEHALQFVVVGLLVVVGAFLAGLTRAPAERVSPANATLGLAWVALFAMQWNAWNDPAVVIYPQQDWTTGRTVEVTSMLLLGTYLPALAFSIREPWWLRDARFALFGALMVAGGLSVIRVSPTPAIDVWTVQQIGADALLHGKNPFIATAVRDTAPGVLRDNVPYVYPPMQVYLTAPAYALGKDVRFTMLAGLVVSGLALRQIVKRRREPLGSLAEDAPALFLWLSPKLFFILEQSWVDPAQLALICVAAWAQLASPKRAGPIAFGIVLAAKQTMFWIAPLAGFIFRWRLRDFIIAGALAVAAYLPFMLWDFHAWKHANFDFLTALPARSDALSLTNWAQQKFLVPFTGKIAFPLAAGVVLLACLRNRGAPSKYGIALVTTYTVFFVFNKWAFANYYFLLGGLACLAAALSFQDDLEPIKSAA